MKAPAQGSSVGVVGASSLLGKELLTVLKERNFPVARLITAEDDEAEPDMPVVDLREGLEPSIADESLSENDFDVVFVAAPPAAWRGSGKAPGQAPFLRSASQLARTAKCTVIDLGDGLAGEPGGRVSIPFLEHDGAPSGIAGSPGHFFTSAHPAAIVLSSLLTRLAADFTVATAVAQILIPASEIGPQAVDELQRQTTNLLSFQKLPEAVFGRQLAFNLLPRFGSSRQKNPALGQIESRIHHQVSAYLAAQSPAREQFPVPALRVLQAPIFHSVVISLYLETVEAASVEEIERALAQERMTITRLREPAPSPADASGSNDILIDAVQRDTSHPKGAWIWAVADNLRLAAVNAVEIAEVERGVFQPPNR